MFDEHPQLDIVSRRNCLQHKMADPEAADGVYVVDGPDGTTSEVYCDMANGGWTLVIAVPGTTRQADVTMVESHSDGNSPSSPLLNRICQQVSVSFWNSS